MSWRVASALASPGGRRGRLSVLFLHRVLPSHDPLLPDEPTPELFESMLLWVKSQFAVLPLSEALDRLDNHELPAGAASLTFDDGYLDNLEVAAPLLQSHGLSATFFVATDFMDGGLMWNDRVIESIRRTAVGTLALPQFGLPPLAVDSLQQRRAAVVTLLDALKYMPFSERLAAVVAVERACGVDQHPALMMNTGHVRRLASAGFEIGAHTCSHPILTQLPDAQAEQEIAGSRARLQAILNAEVPLFAYPNGREGKDFDMRHREMARRAGFTAAFTTEPGVSHHTSDRWRLPRFTPWSRRPLPFRLQLLRNQLQRSGHRMP